MTAAELTYFPVTGFWYGLESPDLGGTTNTLQFRVISGFVTFYPRLPNDFVANVGNLDIGGGTGQPTALGIPPVLARIYAGQLCTINRADTPGIQLLSNSAVIANQIRAVSPPGLIYDVSFSQVVYADAARTMSNFAFVAPTDTTTVCLTDPALIRLEYLGPGA